MKLYQLKKKLSGLVQNGMGKKNTYDSEHQNNPIPTLFLHGPLTIRTNTILLYKFNIENCRPSGLQFRPHQIHIKFLTCLFRLFLAV